MKLFDKVCGKFGIMDADEERGEQEEPVAAPAPEPSMPFARPAPQEPVPAHNVVDFHAAVSAREGMGPGRMKVIVIEPKGFDDAQEVANCLRDKRPVVINFEHTDPEAAKRIIDFISGTTYALNGEIKKVGRSVFLCAPSNVNVTYTEEEKKVSTEMPWLKKQ